MSWVLFRGTFKRTITMLRRYPFNTLSGLVTMYIVFVLLFSGARALGGTVDMGDTIEGLVVGYFVWVLAMIAYSELSWDITAEAQAGTLEQRYLSPFGFHLVNAAYLLSNLAFNLVMAGVMLGLMMLTTGQRLVLDLISILPLLLVTVSAVYGVGFIMGGLALIYKRVQSAFQILQFVFVAFLVVPLGRYPLARALPLTLGNNLLRQVMVDGVRIWQLSPLDLVTVTAVSLGYLFLGVYVFRRCEEVARRDGLFGQY